MQSEVETKGDVSNLGSSDGSVALSGIEEVQKRMDSCVKRVKSIHDSMQVLNKERNALSEYAQASLAKLFEFAIERMRLQ